MIEEANLCQLCFGKIYQRKCFGNGIIWQVTYPNLRTYQLNVSGKQSPITSSKVALSSAMLPGEQETCDFFSFLNFNRHPSKNSFNFCNISY